MSLPHQHSVGLDMARQRGQIDSRVLASPERIAEELIVAGESVKLIGCQQHV